MTSNASPPGNTGLGVSQRTMPSNSSANACSPPATCCCCAACSLSCDCASASNCLARRAAWLVPPWIVPTHGYTLVDAGLVKSRSYTNASPRPIHCRALVPERLQSGLWCAFARPPLAIPGQRERIHHRPGTGVAMEVIKDEQHRVRMCPGRRRVLLARTRAAGHRIRCTTNRAPPPTP